MRILLILFFSLSLSIFYNQLALSASKRSPSVTLGSISSITISTAQASANVTDDGGASVTHKGVCWNTTGNPRTSDTCTDEGTGTGVFTSSITGLAVGITYYVSAYATNSEGTSYNGNTSFTTSANTVPALPLWAWFVFIFLLIGSPSLISRKYR